MTKASPIYTINCIDRMPKFDVVIGNPPYKGQLHLKFLDLAIDISKEFVCFIEPAGWILSGKPNRHITKYQKKLKERISSFKFNLDLHNPFYLFNDNVMVGSYVGIFSIDKLNDSEIIVKNEINGECFSYDNMHEIDKYGNSPIYLSLKEKIINFTKKENLYLHQELKQNKYNYIINMPQLRGCYDDKKNSFYWPDFYTFFNKQTSVELEKKLIISFSFQRKVETENFLNYLKGDFARFCLSIYKHDNRNLQTGELASVPWLDFTESWDDEKLYKYFKLTPDEIKFIEERIPKYYA